MIRIIGWFAAGTLAFVFGTMDTAARVTADAPADAAKPALGGIWQLNRDLSSAPGGMGGDGAGAAPGGGRRGGPGGGGMGRPGGMGGGRGGMGGGGGRGGPGGDERAEEMQRMREVMRELLQPAARLTIVQHDETVSLTDDQGRVRKFATTGKSEKHQLNAATLETTSRWAQGALVTEWKTGRGPTVVRTLRVDPAVQRLTIETTMKGSRGGGVRPPIKHVYDLIVE